MTDNWWPTLGTWNHIAMVRQSNTGRVYLNGVQQQTQASWNQDYSGTWTIHWGDKYNNDVNSEILGKMDQIRISNSVRYADGTTFTPPTTPFTTDANTKLLIQSDFSEGGLGADHSGNYAYFTPTNLTADDMMLDSPMNNFATLNPLFKYWGTSVVNVSTYSEGNTQLNCSGPYGFGVGTFSVGSGKWYYEIAGITDAQTTIGAWKEEGLTYTNVTFSALWNYRYYGQNGIVYNDNGNTVQTYSTYTTGDVIGCALDMDNGKIFFAKNGTWQGSSDPAAGTNPAATTNLTDGKPWIPGFTADSSQSVKVNFGQDSSFSGSETAQGNQDENNKGDFYYAPPAGFLALCTDNLAEPLISGVQTSEHFNTVLYTGDGAVDHDITGVGFQPDFSWIKMRSSTGQHMLFDVIRGAGEYLVSSNNEEGKTDATSLLSFDSDGISVGSGYHVNSNTATFVNWNWKGGGAGVTNTDGNMSGTVTVSANSTANGFSIVKWTGSGATNTVGHGLAQAPELIIVKNYSTDVQNWAVGATVVYSGWTGRAGELNDTGAQSASSAYWNDTVPSASVFTVSTENNVNKSGDNMIAYCFHSVEGYSKVGKYTGNASADGAFVYCGFRPAFLIAKNYGASGKPWVMYDDKRDTYNEMYKQLVANDNAAANTSEGRLDFVSNGIKWRIGDSYHNDGSFMYIAFAESPFKTSNAR